jgi:hypothetical protein
MSEDLAHSPLNYRLRRLHDDAVYRDPRMASHALLRDRRLLDPKVEAEPPMARLQKAVQGEGPRITGVPRGEEGKPQPCLSKADDSRQIGLDPVAPRPRIRPEFTKKRRQIGAIESPWDLPEKVADP